VGRVFARPTGFGMTLLPHWPYSFDREPPGTDTVRVTSWTTSGPLRALVQPGRLSATTEAVYLVEGLDAHVAPTRPSRHAGPTTASSRSATPGKS
jgi:hypothetical protein